MNKSIHDKIAHQQLKLPLLIVEKLQNILENIQARTQVQKVRTLSQLMKHSRKRNSSPSTLFIYRIETFHTAPFPTGKKNVISYCKTKQFLLHTMVHKFFSREKSPLSSNFPIFKLNQLTAWAAPKRVTFRFPPKHLILMIR